MTETQQPTNPVIPIIDLTEYQTNFLESTQRYPAMVSAWGTGKTFLMIIKLLQIAQTHPGAQILILRKQYTDLRDSTCKDFEAYTGIKIDSSRNAAVPAFDIAGNRGPDSNIMFRHMEEINPNNLQNMNLAAFGIEQAEELDTDAPFFLLCGRLRWKGIAQQQGIIIANTNGHNWIHNLWKVPNKLVDKAGIDQGMLIEAVTFDNAHNLPKSWLDSLEILRINKPKIYARFVMNSWEDSDTIDNCIAEEDVRACIEFNLPAPYGNRVLVSCDPARFGDDEAPIGTFANGKLTETKVYTGKSTIDIATRTVMQAQDAEAGLIIIDGVGMGAGVVDYARTLTSIPIIDFNGASRPIVADEERALKYFNLRSQTWYEAGLAFKNREISIPDDPELIKQLCAVKYEIKGGKIKVEDKENVKKANRLGCSPDRADMLVMAIHAKKECPDIGIKRMEESITSYMKGPETPAWRQARTANVH